MIDPSGALNVHLPVDEVNWFEFLYFSRATNSTRGGWNFKEHWQTSALRRLTGENAHFLRIWTENSLDESDRSLPTPRTSSFMFDRKNSMERGNLVREIEAIRTENELNYALFTGAIGIGGVQLVGYEIPLCEDSEGQLKADLFGVSGDGDVLEIFELKKATNHGDSPLFALTEAICYALQTLRCGKALLSELDRKHRGCLRESFSRVHLTLLAPSKYWDYWCGDQDGRTAVEREFQKIIEQVNRGLTRTSCRLTLSCRAL